MKSNQINQSKIQNPKSKILLWDIDGTLMISRRGGAYKDYFAPALEKVFGTSGKLQGMSVSGMTDLQIAAEALQNEQITLEEIYAKVGEFHQTLVAEMERIKLSGGHQFERLEGVREILEATAQHPNFLNILLTGNLPNAAKFKLDFIGLTDFFDFSLSAFGDKSHQRQDLPQLAADNLRARFDYEFAPSQFIIIGDTPNDILAARHFGAKVISVATGRNHPPEELLPYQPDVLIENLIDTEKVLQILETI